MIDINIKIFKLRIKLQIDCKCEKHEEYAEESKEDVENADTRIEDTISESLYDLNEEDNSVEETHISEQKRIFEEELRNLPIYDIPDNEDVPPRYQITDDVEIITDRYEKEVEDIIEGRR